VSTRTQLGRLLRSELVKLRSVRSTVWTLAATVVVCVAVPLLLSLAVINDPHHAEGPNWDPTGLSLSGLYLGQLLVGSLGVLVISAEYSTGTIRATLSAAPQRSLVLVAKTVTFSAVVAVVAFVTTFVAFLTVQAVLGTHHLGTSLGTPPAMRMVVGGALYLVAVGLLGLGIGAIVRTTAAGIVTVVGLLFVLPVVGSFLPPSWQEHTVKYLPGNEASSVLSARYDPTQLGPWSGLALFAGYAVLALVVGGLLLRRRDA
jgi:ABC-type transport system involved in multi-copper enzyme maturation permease subunit